MNRPSFLPWKQIFYIWLTSRLVVLLSWAISTAFVPGLGLKESWLKWDGSWYLSIVNNGYSSAVPSGQSNIAFFPGLPLLARAASAMPGVSPFAGAVLVSALFGFLAVLLFNRFATRYVEGELATTATILFALSPGTVVLSMIYSEGLFISLALIVLTLVTKSRLIPAAILTIPLGLVRPSAFVVVLIVVYSSMLNYWTDRKTKNLFPILIAPMGMLMYAGYLRLHVGSVSSYFETQQDGWGERFSLTARFEDLSQLFQWLFGGFGAADWNRVVPGTFLVLAMFGLWGCHKLNIPKIWIAYSLGIISTAFFSQTLGMRPRFFLTAFPLTLGISHYLRLQSARQIAVAISTTGLFLYSLVVYGLLYQTP